MKLALALPVACGAQSIATAQTVASVLVSSNMPVDSDRCGQRLQGTVHYLEKVKEIRNG